MGDEPQGPFYEFDLGDLGDAFRFETPEELIAWCQKELDHWSWIEKVTISHGYQEFGNIVMEGPRNILNHAQSFQSSPRQITACASTHCFRLTTVSGGQSIPRIPKPSS